jgi:Uma2 family endonuclease
MVDHTQIRMTADEFLALPETNLQRQLINGEVIEAMTGPELEHQDVVGDIFVLLKQAVKILGGKAYVAPVDVYFDESNITQPDVFWLAPDSNCEAEGSRRLRGAPDLIAEVLSPSTARYDRREKFHLYQKYGVREYWLVDPRDRLIEVWQQKDGAFVRLDVYGVGETFTSALIGNVETNTIFVG